VAATECRIVDVERRIPLPAGSPGEVEVRGPQVMLGYLDAGAATGIGPDGWLTTGDIGFQDDDGWLFLVDRIKDVFKCDNELVSPAELERLLNQQSAVRDCVVVDHPDEVHGAVAHALVVVGENAGDGPLAGIAASVNDRVPYWQQVRYIQRVDAIPRSPAGKLERRAFRSWIDSSATHIPPLEEGSHHGAAHQQDDRNR
jgi:long-chain acyl-CoA synthetase